MPVSRNGVGSRCITGRGPLYRLLVAAVLACPSAGDAADATLSVALEAHGGTLLRELRTLAADARLVDTWPGQSRRPDPPWDGASGFQRHAVDFRAQRYAETTHWVASGNYPFRSLTVSDGADSFAANLDEGYWRPIDADFPERVLDFRLALAPLALRDATAVDGSHGDGEHSRDVARVPATIDGRDVTLWIDRAHERLRRLERTLPGGEHQAIHYDGFERVDGILFNRVARIHYEGALVREIRFRGIAPNVSLADRFHRPPDLEEHVDASEPGARAFRARRLGDGVWFIGEGVHYQLFVELEDFVVAVGSVAGVEKRLAELARRVPEKPLRYAVVTHHHNDHLDGVRALAAAGAILLTAPTHEAVVREASGDPAASIETVAGERVIGDARRTLRVLQIGPNSHADEMLAAYLPAAKLLFSADMFVQPPERPIRARIPPIRDLAIAIESLGLDVESLVDPHSPRVNAGSDLETAMSR